MGSSLESYVRQFVRSLTTSLFDSLKNTRSDSSSRRSSSSKRRDRKSRTSSRTDTHVVPLSEALDHVDYSPSEDGDADPGEVAWTWVPYEEDETRGKDRPVVVLGRGKSGVYVAQMTSKDHDKDAAQEARYGRYWLDIGSGPWDSRGRPSEVRLDRALWVPVSEIRREGAVLSKKIFLKVIAAMKKVEKHKR